MGQASLEKAIALHPKWNEAHRVLAFALYFVGKKKRALEEASSALVLDKNDGEARRLKDAILRERRQAGPASRRR